MSELVFHSHSEADTDRLGAALADALPDGTTLALNGTLGAGKTRLVQAIATACGIDRESVISPTFVLCQHHHGRRTIHHFDAYRLRDDDEFLELGPEEYFESPGLTIIEWANRVQRCLPPAHIEIQIEIAGPASREIRLIARGDGLSAPLTWLAERLY